MCQPTVTRKRMSATTPKKPRRAEQQETGQQNRGRLPTVNGRSEIAVATGRRVRRPRACKAKESRDGPTAGMRGIVDAPEAVRQPPKRRRRRLLRLRFNHPQLAPAALPEAKQKGDRQGGHPGG